MISWALSLTFYQPIIECNYFWYLPQLTLHCWCPVFKMICTESLQHILKSRSSFQHSYKIKVAVDCDDSNSLDGWDNYDCKSHMGYKKIQSNENKNLVITWYFLLVGSIQYKIHTREQLPFKKRVWFLNPKVNEISLDTIYVMQRYEGASSILSTVLCRCFNFIAIVSLYVGIPFMSTRTKKGRFIYHNRRIRNFIKLDLKMSRKQIKRHDLIAYHE